MDANLRCECCRAPLAGQAVGGLCGNCLLKLALDPSPENVSLTASPDEPVVHPSASPTANHQSPVSHEQVGSFPRDEVLGMTIGRYKLLEKIGEGGGGVVYVAEQSEPVRRRVALKGSLRACSWC